MREQATAERMREDIRNGTLHARLLAEVIELDSNIFPIRDTVFSAKIVSESSDEEVFQVTTQLLR